MNPLLSTVNNGLNSAFGGTSAGYVSSFNPAPNAASVLKNVQPGGSSLNNTVKSSVSSAAPAKSLGQPSSLTSQYAANGVNADQVAAIEAQVRGSLNPAPSNPPIVIKPTNENGAVSSDALGSSSSYAGTFANRNTLQQLQDNIYQQSLLSPEEIKARQNLTGSQQEGLSLADQTNTELDRLASTSGLTKEQALGFINETQRRANVSKTQNAIQQSAYSNVLQNSGLIRQNQLSAYQTLYGMQKPTELAPGSQLVNPMTGQAITQGLGVNPAVAATYASQLFNDDLKTGTQRLLQDGSVDTSFYFQKAQQMLGGSAQSAGMGGSFGGSTQSGQAHTGGLPQAIQPYVTQTTEGQQYINEDKLPAAQKDFIKQQAAMSGIPYLTTEDVAKVRSIDVTGQNLDQLGGLVNTVLGSGITGRLGTGMILNPLKQFFQTDKDISSFNTYRDTAINTIQALAGGAGSGLRLNESEIKTATSNLPTINDNIETANQKLNLLRGFLGKWKTQLLGNSTASPTGTSGGNSVGWF